LGWWGFGFGVAIREYPFCGIVEGVLKAITYSLERFANGTAKLNGLDEN
jgi:hypothetical protein